MSTPVMFNRRLRKNEISDWLNLIEQFTESGCADRNLAHSYLQLPEAIAFVSSINEEIIGGTAIYRDKTRLGMVLSSAAINRKYRETSAYHIIKTSLPFMKTVAIRDVDAIVAKAPLRKGMGFPASFGLDSWLEKILEKIGFVPVGKISSYTLERDSNTIRISDETKWDTQPNVQGARQLIWSMCKTEGLATSAIWNALDFAISRGVLKTYSVGGSTRVVASIDHINQASLLGLLMVDSEYSMNDAALQIASELHREHRPMIHFPLIGENQHPLVEMLSDQLGGSLKEQTMTLMRKYL